MQIQREFCSSLVDLDDCLWLLGLGSTRHVEPLDPEISTVGDPRLRCRFWNDFCGVAGLDRNAQASLQCGYEPTDSGDHGGLSDPGGLLRSVDCVATGNRMERDRGVYQFLKRRRIPSFRAEGEMESNNVSK